MGKIKFYGLEEFVMEKLYKEGMNSRQISERVLLEKGIKLSHSTVEVFRKDMLKHARKYFESDEEYKNKLAGMQIDSLEMIYDNLMEIQEKLDEFRDDPKKWQAHSTYLDKSLKLLYIVLKKNKEIGPDIQVNKTTNVMNITNAFQGRVMELIDYILSHGGSLEMLPSEWQEVYKKAKGMYAYA